MVLLVTYDLHKPDRDYKDVIAKIKTFGSWAHDEESVWLVDTTKTPEECRDALTNVAAEATYFVVELRRHWSSGKLDKDVVAWLKHSDRSW